MTKQLEDYPELDKWLDRYKREDGLMGYEVCALVVENKLLELAQQLESQEKEIEQLQQENNEYKTTTENYMMDYKAIRKSAFTEMITCLQMRLIKNESSNQPLSESIKEMIDQMGGDFSNALAEHDKEVTKEFVDFVKSSEGLTGIEKVTIHALWVKFTQLKESK